MAQWMLMKVHSRLAEHYSIFETLEIQGVVNYFASVLVKLKGIFCLFYGFRINKHISSYFHMQKSKIFFLLNNKVEAHSISYFSLS